MDTSATRDAPAKMTAQHKLFDIVVILKGLNGLLELVGGLALLLIPTGAILSWVDYLTHSELLSDPTDFFANSFVHWATNFGHDTQVFAAVYLLFHGIAKSGLAALLLLGQKIAYPIAIVLFTAFVCYAGYRLHLHWSWALAAFVAFDVFTIGVIAREWRAEGATA